MIAKSYISQNLDRIERLYIRARSVKSGLFYSKLAILELGGWIEMSMDDIVRRQAKRILHEPASLSKVEQIIKKTYGFDYDFHFRRMLIQVIGLVGVEKFERLIDPAKFHAMSATLNSIKAYRDQEAHEYTKGITRILDAPSVTKSKFVTIYDGLIDIERVLKKL